MRYTRVVCVLSGGGAKSAAHVGALKAMEEWKLSPSHYVGTSMGAVMAACYAAGLGYDELLVRISAVARGDVARVWPPALLGPYATHLLRARPLRDTIGDLVPARSFSDLAAPLTVTATDTETGNLVLFGAGGTDVPLLDALYASCALPVFYPPARIDGRTYADGGLRAVLPLDVAAQFDPDMVYAVNVGPVFAGVPVPAERALPGMVRSHDTAVRILMAGQIRATIERWRDGPYPVVLVEPEVEPGTFAVGKAFAHVSAGYRAAARALATWETRDEGRETRDEGPAGQPRRRKAATRRKPPSKK